MSLDQEYQSRIDPYRSVEKHYVRVHGWLPAAQRRLEATRRLPKRQYDFTRYFTLCGPEAIDVGFFAEREIIERDQRGHPGVVFCEVDLRNFREIAPRVGRCAGQFQAEFEKLVFRKDFPRFCPFDIINLDFSRVCFPRWDKSESSTMRAMKQMMKLQEEKRRSFDLYVTFKSRRSEAHPQAVSELRDMMNDNLRRHTSLATAFSRTGAPNVESLLKKSFDSFVFKTFPKLIIEYGAEHHFFGSCDDQYLYSRRDSYGRYSILKFVFLFDYAKGGLSAVHRVLARVPDEVEKAFQITPMDVDQLIRNKTERDQLLSEVQWLVQKMRKPQSWRDRSRWQPLRGDVV